MANRRRGLTLRAGLDMAGLGVDNGPLDMAWSGARKGTVEVVVGPCRVGADSGRVGVGLRRVGVDPHRVGVDPHWVGVDPHRVGAGFGHDGVWFDALVVQVAGRRAPSVRARRVQSVDNRQNR